MTRNRIRDTERAPVRFVIKRETIRWSRGGTGYRTVRDAPIFETHEAAEAYMREHYGRLGARHCVEAVRPKPEKARHDTHCQICERQIEAGSGLIAHHGYQRPGQGWQTASCMGARHKPYEVACDVIPAAIDTIKDYIERNEKKAADWRREPPRGIGAEVRISKGWEDRRTCPVTLLRPAETDTFRFTRAAEGPVTDGYAPRAAEDYVSAYRSRIAEAESGARMAGHDLRRLEKRLADWKPAEGGKR